MADELFYRAKNARTGDVIPILIDETYHLFYLKAWKNNAKETAPKGWHHMETCDLLNMSKETPIGVIGGTGDIIFHAGQYHLFACIFPDGKQFITHYVSPDGDLNHWEMIKEDTFGPDGKIYHPSDWRDPRIIYREDLDEFWMIMAARKNDAHSQTGCVGLCVSKDLKHWEYREPFYYPQRFNGALECPDFFCMGEWEYLIFSSYTTLFGNYYVKRKKGESTFSIPKNHRLDARAFYAAKTAGKESERYLFGWNPEKEENLFGFWPDKLEAKDYRTFDWGGNMVIHRLCQKEDGDLGLKFPEKRNSFFNKKVNNIYTPVTDGMILRDEKVCTSEKNSQQMMLMQKLPENVKTNMSITAKDTYQAGIALHVSEEMKEGYYFLIEPSSSRIIYRSWLRMSEVGGKTFPYDVEMEAPLRESADGKYKLEVAVEGTAGTVYVNDDAAISFRMYDHLSGNLGLIATGDVRFSNIEMFTR